MEFGLREVLILVGLVVIAGILADGFRRMRKSKLGELELPTEIGGSCEDEWEIYRSELPNGGARKIDLGPRKAGPSQSARTEPGLDDDFGLALEDDSPDVLVDDDVAVVSPIRRRPMPADARVATLKRESVKRESVKHEPVRREPLQEVRAESEQDYVDDLVQPEVNEQDQNDLFGDDDLLVASRAEQDARLARKTGAESKARQAEMEVDPSLQEVLVINVMARHGEMAGSDLVRVMLSCGFRFGDMNIFHRYEQHSGKGGLLFSAANVVEPGVFDMENMDTFTTPGICIFMSLPGPKRAIHSFEIMMDSARRIANLLDAEVKDEHHNVMRQQTAEHYRQRVLDFERRYMSFVASQKQH